MQVESSIPVAQQRLLFNGQELSNPSSSLASAGVKDNDLLMLLPAQQQQAAPRQVQKYG